MLRLLTLLLGPIFAKEVIEVARRRRYYWNRVLYGSALLAALLLVGERCRQQVQAEGRYTIRIMAATGENLFRTVSFVQYGAVWILVPVFVCGTIAGERHERTLDDLLITELSDRAIVLGKLGSRVVALVLLVLAAVPVLGLLPLFGGVDPGALWRVALATLLAVLFAGAHAIYFSATTDSTLGALVRTYWWLAVWLFAVPAAVMVPVNVLQPAADSPLWLGGLAAGFLFNPLGTFLVASDGFAYQALVSRVGVGFFVLGFVPATAWSLLVIGLAIKRLRQTPVSLSLRLREVPLVRAYRAHLRKDIAQLMEPILEGEDFRSFRILTSAWRNPLWRRARLTRVYDRAGYMGLIQWAGWIVVFLFVLLLMAFGRRDHLDQQSALMFLGPLWTGVLILTTVLAATSLVGDRRRGFLDLVLITSLRSRAIVDGTLFALWEHLRRSFFLVWFMALCFGLAELPGLHESFCSAVTATLFCGLLLLYGTVFSLVARTTTLALLAAFLVPALSNLGMLVALPLVGGYAGSILLPVSGAALAAGWFAVRRHQTLATVSWYLLALHLFLVELAAAWVRAVLASGSAYSHVILAPAELILDPWRGTGWRSLADSFHWQAVYLSYWAVLVVNFVWVRHWAIKNFNDLAGRTRQRVAASRSLLPAGSFLRASAFKLIWRHGPQ
jgi:ABC-type transport system involved in multi-copper enzyme maturation permease subunit